MEALAGATEIEFSVAVVSVRVVLADIEPSVAVITVEPVPVRVAWPLALTVATAVLAELQVTLEVRSEVELSE